MMMTADDSFDPDTPTADGVTGAFDAVSSVGDVSAELLELTVQHPSVGICVVTVDGELDMLTTPMLDTCLREQLAAAPPHLVLNLTPVRFLSATGLNCIVLVRELVQQLPGTQLHLAGMNTRVVARPLEITGLLRLFDAYPTLTDALAALTE